MALVHNVIIRGLNGIYLSASSVPEAQQADFIGYVKCWWEFVHGHHTNEEDNIFPAIEKGAGTPGLMDTDIGEHATFLQGLADLKKYLDEVTAQPKTFDPKQLLQHLDSFAPTLHGHLVAEIPRLLSLSRFGDKIPFTQIMAKEGNKTHITLSKTGGMIYFMRNLDVDYEDGLWKDWPPIPGPARLIVMKTLGNWNRRWWKWASCDESGHLQALTVKSDVDA
jgi:hypothetical protein